MSANSNPSSANYQLCESSASWLIRFTAQIPFTTPITSAFIEKQVYSQRCIASTFRDIDIWDTKACLTDFFDWQTLLDPVAESIPLDVIEFVMSLLVDLEDVLFKDSWTANVYEHYVLLHAFRAVSLNDHLVGRFVLPIPRSEQRLRPLDDAWSMFQLMCLEMRRTNALDPRIALPAIAQYGRFLSDAAGAIVPADFPKKGHDRFVEIIMKRKWLAR